MIAFQTEQEGLEMDDQSGTGPNPPPPSKVFCWPALTETLDAPHHKPYELGRMLPMPIMAIKQSI
jgi:hypothetical protein